MRYDRGFGERAEGRKMVVSGKANNVGYMPKRLEMVVVWWSWVARFIKN